MILFMGAIFFGMWILARLLPNTQGEKYANYTGRITVRIQTREMVDPTSYFDSNKNRNVKQEKCYVTHEFYVNGRRYEGSSESSDSELDKNEQVICYDPEDPSKNCTLWYLEKQINGHIFS